MAQFKKGKELEVKGKQAQGHAEAKMDNTEIMKQLYLLAQEHCGLKVGDWVRVLRKPYSLDEAGWEGAICTDYSSMVGHTYKIDDITEHGIALLIHNDRYVNYLPYFVLEKVEKPAHKFKPFDKVLVRDSSKENWRCNIFSHWVGGDYPYYCIKNPYRYCIPYEGNEHLIGTTDMPEE